MLTPVTYGRLLDSRRCRLILCTIGATLIARWTSEALKSAHRLFGVVAFVRGLLIGREVRKMNKIIHNRRDDATCFASPEFFRIELDAKRIVDKFASPSPATLSSFA